MPDPVEQRTIAAIITVALCLTFAWNRIAQRQISPSVGMRVAERC